MERGDRVGHLERSWPAVDADIAADARACVRAASASVPASVAELQDGRRRSPGASIRRHVSARVSEPGVELGQEAERVHLERRRVDDPLEAVGRDVVAAV